MSPLLGNAPRKREILLFLRGDVGEHRCYLRAAVANARTVCTPCIHRP